MPYRMTMMMESAWRQSLALSLFRNAQQLVSVLSSGAIHQGPQA